MEITLYSTHCPQCRFLEKMLNEKHIEFTVVEDVSIMQKMGMVSAPQLEVDGTLMNMQSALRWLNGK